MLIRKDNDMDESKTVPEPLREIAAAEHGIELAEMFRGLANRVEREYMQLPMLEGKPLRVGDKVDGYNQVDAEVVAIMNETMVVARSTIKGGHGYHDEAYPLLLWDVRELKRHKQPDTQERIEADARKSCFEYWGCVDFMCSDCPAMVDGKKPCERYGINGCEKAQRLDLLYRQRELLERGQA